jgi:phage/plasmid-associated DNA primase
MNDLLVFLNARRAVKGGRWNVTGLGYDRGSYYIPDADYDEFLRIYSTTVFGLGATPSLLERHTEFSPALIDLDFRYELCDGLSEDRRFTMDDIRKFVDVYARYLRSAVTIAGPVRFFVMLKEGPSVCKGLLKDGVHIVCPDVAFHPCFFKAIRTAMLDADVVQSCFPGLANDPADVFDEAVIQRNNWFLYGAGKPDAGWYKVAACFSSNCGADAVSEESFSSMTDLDMVRLFSIRRRGASEFIVPEENAADWAHMMDSASGGSVSCEEPTSDKLSEQISAILNMSHYGDWNVINQGDSKYKLTFSSNWCLVNGEAIHSSAKHSCIYVREDGATAHCFSHGKRHFVEEGRALYGLLSGCDTDVCMIQDDLTAPALAPAPAPASASNSDPSCSSSLNTIEECTDELPEGGGMIDDVYACEKFVALLGDEIHRDAADIWIFDRNTGMWSSDSTVLYGAIHRLRRHLILKSGVDDKKVFNYGGSTRNIRNMLVHLKALVPVDNFMREAAIESLNYLLFRNGIFNVKTGLFKAGFDKTLVFTVRIDRNFPKERLLSAERQVNDILFVQPFADAAVGDYLKMRLARGIFGCYTDKKFVCALGDADCGKGTITTAMQRAFGGFVTEWDANNIKYNARSGADEAKKLAWIYPLLGCRLAISNECRMDKMSIDGNLLKTLSSGGDAIIARLNFQNQSTLENRTTFMYMGNDMPPITPNDSGIRTRVRAVRFVNRFVEKPVAANEKRADPEIKKRFDTVEWMNAMFWVIVDAYALPTTEPTAVKDETQEWVPSESGQFKELLEEEYVIDLASVADDNYVKARELADYIREGIMNMSDTKVGRELGKLGLVKDVKKIGKKTIKIWKGIKKIVEEE